VDVSITYSSTSLLQSSSRFLKELTEEASTTLAGNLFHVLGWLVGWLGFNGTFSTNRPCRAMFHVLIIFWQKKHLLTCSLHLFTFECWNICSQDYSFPGTFVPMMELSFSGPFVPWNFRSLDRSFPGTFAPWTVLYLELSFLGPFVPWTIRSRDRILRRKFIPLTTTVAIHHSLCT